MKAILKYLSIITIVLIIPIPASSIQDDFKVDAHPEERCIKPGRFHFYTVKVNFYGGFTGPVFLSVEGLPSGVSGEFDKNPVNVTGGSGQSETKLNITTKEDTSSGNYTLTIVGYNEKLGRRETNVILNIGDCGGGGGGFELKADPGSVSIEPGDTAKYKISAVCDRDFEVELSSYDIPSGATSSFDPTEVLETGAGSTYLIIESDLTIKKGKYEIKVKSKGDFNDEVVVTLLVGEKPPEEPGLLDVEKSVAPTRAGVGSILVYTLKIYNNGRGDVTGVKIKDSLPSGFGYVRGSTILSGKKYSDPSGSRILIWDIEDLSGGSSVTLKYHAVVKPNVKRGTNTNTVIVTGTDKTGASLVARDTANVAVSWESLERNGKIKGRVFVDKNGNGLKNADEDGLGGVTVIMESGSRVVTDTWGQFEFEEVRPGEHLVAVDERKLPEYYFVIDDASSIVSVYEGGTSRANFPLGYNPPPPPPEEVKPTDEEIELARKAEEERKKKEEEKKKALSGKVSGRVFIDGDSDEKYDIGEELVEDVVVLLDGSRRATTDKNGKFSFDKVSPGRHSISVYENKEFKEKYKYTKDEKIRISVKTGFNSKVDVPVVELKGIRINIELTVDR